MSRLIRVAYDFDDTVWPIMEVLQHLTGDLRFNAVTNPSWKHPVEYAGGPEAFEKLVAESCKPHVMRHFQPFPGSIAALNRLEELNVELELLTARPDDALAAVVDILTANGHKPHAVTSKSGHDKVQYCLDNNVDALVDDAPHTIEAAHAAGLPIASLRWGHNSAVLDRLGIPYASDWHGLEFIVLQMLGFH